jgi:hypothetical protein
VKVVEVQSLPVEFFVQLQKYCVPQEKAADFKKAYIKAQTLKH